LTAAVMDGISKALGVSVADRPKQKRYIGNTYEIKE
jgi:hypothetical protein